MLTFLNFITEATMNATVGNSTAERHKENYLNKGVISSTSFTMNKPHGDIPAGAEVNISGVKNIDGKYHAVVKHKGKTVHVPISKINKPKIGRAGSNPEQAEESHMNDLNDQIEKAKKKSGVKELTIYTSTGRKKVSRVVKAPSTGKQKPKADFVFHNEKGEDTHYVSHKDGSKPQHFQQLGGVTNETNHPTIKKVAKHLAKNHPQGVTGTVSYSLDRSKPENEELVNRAAFGRNFGKERGVENVDEIHQGPMKLVPHPNGKAGHYVLQSNNVISNGRIPHDEEHEVVVNAMHRGDRSNFVPKTRVGIWFKKSRKANQQVSLK